MYKFMNMGAFAGASVLHPLADAQTAVGWSDVSSIMSAITSQISVSTIVAVIAGALGISIGIAFMWWVARKGVRTLMSAFRKGKVSV